MTDRARRAGGAPLPDPFRYADFRAFLKDHYIARKRADRRFSYGVFARAAGIPRNHLKVVVDGGKSLTPRFLEGYVRALRLAGAQAECFRRLVEAGQARSVAAREAAEASLQRLRFDVDRREMGAGEFRALARRWFQVIVMGLSRIDGFRADPVWIEKAMMGRVSRRQAAEALRFLAAGRYLRIGKGGGVETDAASFRMDAAADSRSFGGLERLHAHLLRLAADQPSARHGYRTISSGQVAMTRAEAEALGGRLFEWIRSTFPYGRRGPVRGNLYLVLNDVVPITDLPEGPPGGKRSRRR